MGRAVTIIVCTAALGASLVAIPASAGGPGTPNRLKLARLSASAS